MLAWSKSLYYLTKLLDSNFLTEEEINVVMRARNHKGSRHPKNTDIITYKMSPINISVQAMNPQLRCKMLNNRFAGEALEKIKRFYDAGIVMNGQIVLCKGINDGKELEYSVEQLMQYAPLMESVSVVPVGLSKYRDGLYPLEAFEKEDAEAVIDYIEKMQRICYEKFK